MNERIRELADHCWKDAFHCSPNGPETYTEFDYDKFAELIVIDCAGIAYNNDGLDNEEISRLILDAFGVK